MLALYWPCRLPTRPEASLSDGSGNFTAAVLPPQPELPGEHSLQAGMATEKSDQIDISVGSNWPMFKNQTSRLSSNPFERTINKDNAQFLGLSWVGLLGDLVDYSSPAVVMSAKTTVW
jgi:hypothetical protein